MRLTHRHGLAVVISFFAAACSDQEKSPAVTGPGNETRLILTLSADADTIPEATSKRLTARVTDQAGLVKPVLVTWRSSNPEIATVSDGMVSAISQGAVSIIASTTGAADTAAVLVIENEIQLDVQPGAAVVALGDTIDFVATARLRSGDIVPIGNFTWTASDTSAASFLTGGLLHTKREGEIAVTAEALMRQATSTVKIFRSPVASVTISPSSANVYKGSTTTLKATLRDQPGRVVDEAVTWGSSDNTKATVDDNGVVTGVGVGSVVITATSERKTGSATVNVLSAPATNLSLNLPSSTLMVGAEMQATIVATDASGQPLTGKTVAYQSTNPSIATVNGSGTVKGITEGSVTISAIVDGLVARQPIAVKGAKATSISISPSSPVVNVGQQSQMTATVVSEDGAPMSNQVVVWSSSNTNVATISSTGLVSGIASGSFVITATSGTLTATVTASVMSAPVAAVRVSPSNLSLVANTQGVVSAEALSDNGNVLPGRIASWSSANPTIASVANNGVVSAVAPGSTTLTATIEGKTASLPITVSAAPVAPVASVSVSLGVAALNPGEQTQASATVTDASGRVLTGRVITWSSLDTAVAKVSASGAVTAYAGGTVTIVATSEGKSGYASLTVNMATAAPVSRIAIEVPTQSLAVGQQIQSVVTLYDASNNVLTGRTITYTSDNSSVITVSSSGVIKGVGGGGTKLRVKSGIAAATETFSVTGTATSVSSITVSPSSSSLSVGQTTQATATAQDAAGVTVAGTTFTWSSSNPAVAAVSPTGLVSAAGAGSAMISASASGKTGTMAVTVSGQSTSTTVASVLVALSPGAISIGGVSQATAVARNSGGTIITGKTATWSLGGSQLANITSSGLVSGLLAGVVPVTATIDGVTGSANLTISSPLAPPPPANVELPRTYLNNSFPVKTGQTIHVAAGGNLQAAFNNAQRGDEIVLAAGATFTGNFTLPVKSGTAASGWIIVRSEQLNQIGPMGTRVSPSSASLMPKIATSNSMPAIKTVGATSGWWFAGIEVLLPPAVTVTNYGLIMLGEQGGSQTSLSAVPSDLVLDRMYIHGQSTSSIQRCVSLNSARSQITDSYITECHGKGFDTQAIWGGNGPGPYKIVNNYLAGAGENVMFGGADPSIPGVVPSDIEIRRNYIHTPITWKTTWTKKNLLELKNASRVLIEGNVLDGSWLDAQTGWAVMFKSVNQSGGCRWCRTTDVTFRKNLIRNAGGGVAIITENNYPVDSTARRILVSENVLDNIATAPYVGDNRGFHVLGPVADAILERNVLSGGASLTASMLLDSNNGGAVRSVFRDNVWAYGMYGIITSGFGSGTASLNAGAPGYTWSNMTFVATTKSGYPTGTIFVTPESSAPLAAQVRSMVSSVVSGATP